MAFGTVLDGMDVVDRISAVPTDEARQPLLPAVITGCGELTPAESAAMGSEGTLYELWRWWGGSPARSSGSNSGLSSLTT